MIYHYGRKEFMISYVTGQVQSIQGQVITLLMGPIGFDIWSSKSSSLAIGDQVSLYVYMYYNQEQGYSLYGFDTMQERAVFGLLLDCSGIGPKIGLAVIQDLGVDLFVESILKHDEKAISRVSGIGAKKAAFIALQLKQKVEDMVKKGTLVLTADSLKEWQTVAQALESLNYSRNEISATMQHIKTLHIDTPSFDVLMRHALSYLAKHTQS